MSHSLRSAGLACASVLALASPAGAQLSVTVEPVQGFESGLLSPLVQTPDGSVYGTSRAGRFGSIFRITPDGKTARAHIFNGVDGAWPAQDSPLLLAADGTLYGMASIEAPSFPRPYACNVLFQLAPNGSYRVVHTFMCPDEPGGVEGLVQGADGLVYGVAAGSGLRQCGPGGHEGCGVVVRLDSEGSLSIVHEFHGADGMHPRGELVRVGGDLYGITRLGGDPGCDGYGCGTVFRLAADGTLTTLARFSEIGGEAPEPHGLLYHPGDQALYGIVRSAAPCNRDDFDWFGYSGCGAIFRLTLDGTMTTLFSFSGGPEGNWPSALAVGTDNELYGVTQAGGVECPDMGTRCGTFFQVTPAGALMALHKFGSPDLGVGPYRLVRGSDGDFYGATLRCHQSDSRCKLIFRVTVHSTEVPNLRQSRLQAPSRVTPGETVVLRDTTVNLGAAASAGTVTSLWLSPGSALFGAALIGERPVPPLAAGGTSAGETVVTLPDQPGVYTLFARADGNREVAETLEFDNVRRLAITVGPDLRIRKPDGLGIEIDPAAPTAGTVTAISVYTANVGGGVAPASVTRLYRSNSGTLTDAVLIAELPTVAVASLTYDHQVVSATLPAGDYFLLALADADDQVVEAREDNVFRLRIHVAPGD
jgi:uncharacterized repeat protein (TIGR03803 family)